MTNFSSLLECSVKQAWVRWLCVWSTECRVSSTMSFAGGPMVAFHLQHLNSCSLSTTTRQPGSTRSSYSAFIQVLSLFFYHTTHVHSAMSVRLSQLCSVRTAHQIELCVFWAQRLILHCRPVLRTFGIKCIKWGTFVWNRCEKEPLISSTAWVTTCLSIQRVQLTLSSQPAMCSVFLP